MLLDVVLVSPCDISREGLSNILALDGFNVVGSFSDIAAIDPVLSEARALIVRDSSDTDAQAADVGKLEELFPNSTVVVLSERFAFKAMMESFRAGAQGYIVKSMKAQPLITALRLAAMGERVVPSDLVDMFNLHPAATYPASGAETGADEAKLSPREHDVLCCLMAGYPNKVIARELDVCEATVKVHVKAILRKLNVHNRTQAAIWASNHAIPDSYVLAS